mmetsp:Transcript_151/g.448  ORF Transcript_151/g.448 Transcript_151/m.448 type:complete len:265 (+) Transcript_151:602-1396(+)
MPHVDALRSTEASHHNAKQCHTRVRPDHLASVPEVPHMVLLELELPAGVPSVLAPPRGHKPNADGTGHDAQLEDGVDPADVDGRVGEERAVDGAGKIAEEAQVAHHDRNAGPRDIHHGKHVAQEAACQAVPDHVLAHEPALGGGGVGHLRNVEEEDAGGHAPEAPHVRQHAHAQEAGAAGEARALAAEEVRHRPALESHKPEAGTCQPEHVAHFDLAEVKLREQQIPHRAHQRLSRAERGMGKQEVEAVVSECLGGLLLRGGPG